MKTVQEYLEENFKGRDENYLYELYDKMIDKASGPVRIMNIEYGAASVLKEIEPIVYNCGFLEWLDSEGFEEREDKYYSQDEIEEAEEAQHIE